MCVARKGLTGANLGWVAMIGLARFLALGRTVLMPGGVQTASIQTPSGEYYIDT